MAVLVDKVMPNKGKAYPCRDCESVSICQLNNRIVLKNDFYLSKIPHMLKHNYFRSSTMLLTVARRARDVCRPHVDTGRNTGLPAPRMPPGFWEIYFPAFPEILVLGMMIDGKPFQNKFFVLHSSIVEESNMDSQNIYFLYVMFLLPYFNTYSLLRYCTQFKPIVGNIFIPQKSSL